VVDLPVLAVGKQPVIGRRLKGEAQVMAGTTENRQTIGHTITQEAETVGASKKKVSEVRLTGKASHAALGGSGRKNL
jgi:hypothetical protein